MLKKLIHAFYPRTCPICEQIIKGNRDICAQCEKEVHPIVEPKCQKCGKAMREGDKLYCRECRKKERTFDKGIAVFEHKDKMKSSIYRFKYDNKRENALYYSRVAVEVYGRQLREWKIDAIVPVPIHRKREIKRGYNQALVFASALSKRTGIPLEKKLIIRKKNTKPQKELNSEMRYFNLKNAFAVRLERAGELKNVLLVDDIFTTGNTVEACSRILKKAGIRHVYVLCISAGVDNSID